MKRPGIETMTDEEYRDMKLAWIDAILSSPRASHVIAEGYPEASLW